MHWFAKQFFNLVIPMEWQGVRCMFNVWDHIWLQMNMSKWYRHARDDDDDLLNAILAKLE